MPRPRTLAIGAFALVLVAAPFIPRGGGDDGALLPSGQQKYDVRPADRVGYNPVTPDLQREIDRVVDQGRALGRVSARSTPGRMAAAMVRCADFEGQRYCLHTGWTESSPAEIQDRAAVATRIAAARARATDSTGDLDLYAALRRTASLTPSARADAERAELTEAARSVAKVWLLRHEIEGVDVPASFLERHPEARAAAPDARSRSGSTTTASPHATSTRPKYRKDYPERARILSPFHVAEQSRTYWCGPTTMQMITWGWSGERRSQQHWAHELGTTTSGTAISDMVRVINQDTGWDRATHAGPYITLDIGSYTFAKWKLLLMRHIVDYKAPVVLHPILLRKFYPYLDDDASGHFQVGRGYDKNGDKPSQVGYFEPWNQQRFDPSEPFIERVQWRHAYRSYRANEAHFQHNIGV
jgi:peptidase C39-like protein